MKKILIGVLLALASEAFAGNGLILLHKRPVPNSYIVRLANVPTDRVDAIANELASQYGFAFEHRGSAVSIFKHAFHGFGATMSDAVAAALAFDPRVEVVEQNAWGSLSSTQTITDPQMWHLDRIDQTTPVTLGNGSYSYQTDGTGVWAYVVDCGVERNHIEFDNDNDPNTPQSNPRVKDGPQFSSDGYPATSPGGGGLMDPQYSGTHGTAAASMLGGKNVGVAKNVNIVPIKVVNFDGGTQLLWRCWGLDWIVSPPDPGGDIQKGNPYPKSPAICSMSIYIDTAVPNNPIVNVPISSFESAVNDVIAGGIAVIASANNQHNSNCTTTPARLAYTNNYPSGYHVISVGGTDEYDALWVNSDQSNPDNLGSNTGPCVDIYAPAHNLKVAYNATIYDPQRGYVSGYFNYRPLDNSGTSFSAPIVAGIAARILQSQPTLTPQQLATAIFSRAVALPSNFDGDNIFINDRLAYLSPNE